jgi:glycosyltransferase involved in cell wall biosynthesis
MKLVIFVPAFNEEKTIGDLISRFPKKITGIEQIQILVVDDGSTDKTMENALNSGADKIISHKKNLGVGAAFMTGIRHAISMNADIFVTMDADSQFNPEQIPDMVIPLLNDQADVVIGSRFLNKNPKDIPKIKLFGNKVFTKIISCLMNQKFTDTQTGFRAYSKEALMNITVVNDFTYTQEVLIDLKFKRMKIEEIPVSVTYNKNRKSRVVKNIFSYTSQSLSIIIRTLVYHKPIFTFGFLGILLISGGILSKIITVTKILGGGISSDLSSGLIILGIVSFMMGIFASVVFKRQSFAEKDLRHHLKQNDNKKDTNKY